MRSVRDADSGPEKGRMEVRRQRPPSLQTRRAVDASRLPKTERPFDPANRLLRRRRRTASADHWLWWHAGRIDADCGSAPLCEEMVADWYRRSTSFYLASLVRRPALRRAGARQLRQASARSELLDTQRDFGKSSLELWRPGLHHHGLRIRADRHFGDLQRAGLHRLCSADRLSGLAELRSDVRAGDACGTTQSV